MDGRINMDRNDRIEEIYARCEAATKQSVTLP
jgi:hypothetical protein